MVSHNKKILTYLALFVLISVFIITLKARSTPENENLVREDIETQLMGINTDDIIIGDINNPIKIFEYSDPDCPYCKDLWAHHRDLESEFPNKIIFIYRFYPLSYLHPTALQSSYSFYCVNKLTTNEKFINYVDEYYRLYTNEYTSTHLDTETLYKKHLSIALSVGVKKTDFDECLRAPETNFKIKNDIVRGELKELTKTPSVIIQLPDGKEVTLSGATYRRIERMLLSILDYLPKTAP